MTRIITAVALVTALAAPAGPVAAAQGARPKPKISADSAQRVALAVVPGGKVRSHELEREKGTLIYSFDIAVAGKPGIEEVNVDATSGAVVAHEHESDAAERKEARRDARERARAKAKRDSAARKP